MADSKSRSISNLPAAIQPTVETPTIGTATDLGTDGAVSVTFTAATRGGRAVSYTATSTPGSITGTSTSSPITVAGLTNGTAYTFAVTGTGFDGAVTSASSASNSVTPTGPSFESIATVTSTGSTNTATFSSIPNTYKHLEIRWIGRSAATSSSLHEDDLVLRINSDSGSNYVYHYLLGESSGSGNVGASLSQTSIFAGKLAENDAISNMFGAGTISIVDYASTTKNKTLSSFMGINHNTIVSGSYAGRVGIISSLWLNTSAITSITLFTNSGSNFVSGSTFALYGIRG